MNGTRKVRAVIYTRISRDAEQEGLGVARQEEDCRTLAEREGMEVVAVYSDNDISASNRSRKQRPGYAQMLADADAGQFDAILAYSNSRLTRRPAEWIDLIKLAQRKNLRVKAVASGEQDLSTADGEAVALTIAVWDAAEAKRTAERVARAHRQRAESGRHNGPRPYGYQKQNGTLTIDPVEAEVVREAVKRVLAGEAIWKITNDFNARGITTTKGGPWATQVLRRMILRWTNAGYRSHQPRDDNGRPVGRETLHRGDWEPIIDRETHERVVALLTDPARRKNNRGTAVRYLLTGLINCGVCDRPLVGTAQFEYDVKVPPLAGSTEPRTRRRIYPHAYKCPHAGCMKVQRRMDDVDAYVQEFTLALLERDGVTILGGDPEAAGAARESIAALEARLALSADLIAEGTMTADQFRRITERLRPQLDAARARLTQASPRSDADGFATDPRTAWEAADIETKRRVIQRIGVNIRIVPIGAGNGRRGVENGIDISPRVQA